MADQVSLTAAESMQATAAAALVLLRRAAGDVRCDKLARESALLFLDAIEVFVSHAPQAHRLAEIAFALRQKRRAAKTA